MTDRMLFPITMDEYAMLVEDDLIFKMVGFGKVSALSYKGGQDISVDPEYAEVARLTIEAIRARPKA